MVSASIYIFISVGRGGRAFRETNLEEWKHSEIYSWLNSFQETHILFFSSMAFSFLGLYFQNDTLGINR